MSENSTVDDKISYGLTEFLTATGAGRDDVELAAHAYRKAGAAVVPLVRPDDVCRLAFMSMIVRPNLRTDCLVVILGDRLIVAWKPPLRKPTAEVVPFSSITAIRKEHGTRSLSHVNLLVISGTPSVTVALSQANADTELAVIRTAIGTGVE